MTKKSLGRIFIYLSVFFILNLFSAGRIAYARTVYIAAPSNLTATDVKQTQITLHWADKSTNESGFQLQRRPIGSSSFTSIATTGANTTTYTNTGLTSGKGYEYRVRAYGGNNYSTYSNTLSVTTLKTNHPPVANNQAITAEFNASKPITLSATDPDGDSITYTVTGNPLHGTLSGTAPNLIYTPFSNYAGSDSFTFNAYDGVAYSNTATVIITVNPAPTGDILFEPNPPSTLLVSGATQVNLSLKSTVSTVCRYSVGSALSYDAMIPFTNTGSTQHSTLITGLNPDPNTVNEVYVRCAADTSFLLHLRYRSLSNMNPAFPRKGNLWGWDNFIQKGLPYCARIDLWLGADSAKPDDIRQLRRLNPNTTIITSINAVENNDVPDESYYLHDMNTGQKIEVWPGSYRLDLTKAKVAEYQAHYAYQLILNSDLMFDGCFFDNVFTANSMESVTQDMYGVVHPVDTNGDGIADTSDVFTNSWKAAILHELEVFRQLMPNAIMSGHALDINNPAIPLTFNGDSIGFLAPEVLDGKRSFGEAMGFYKDWLSKAKTPAVTMIESAPLGEISYGYGYSWDDPKIMPASTLEFARTYYPYVRFGLALTLMDDGYFAHEFGDTGHGNDWWYDELNFNLGYPKGPAQSISLDGTVPVNIMANGDFEDPTLSAWGIWADTAYGYSASFSRDTTTAAHGTASARISVTAAAGSDWQIEFCQYNHTLQKGTTYDFTFWAKSDIPRSISLSVSKQVPDWRSYGLYTQVPIGTTWKQYSVSFIALEDANDARIEFFLGQATGNTWIDDVKVSKSGPEIFRRDYDNGIVLLNPASEPQTITVGPGYARLSGSQAPRYEFILDDAQPAFSTTSGIWSTVTQDTGEWQASGPYYHDWGDSCHQTTASGSTAQWAIPIEAADSYTIKAWWPNRDIYSASVVFEVVRNGEILATKTLSQRNTGNQWNLIASVSLGPGDNVFVRLRSTNNDPAIADAIYVSSDNLRYNDGTAVDSVKLQPMDGIILQRTP